MNISGKMPVSYVEIITETLEENGVEIYDFKYDAQTGDAEIRLSEQSIDVIKEGGESFVRRLGRSAMEKVSGITEMTLDALLTILEKAFDYVEYHREVFVWGMIAGGVVIGLAGIGVAMYTIFDGSAIKAILGVLAAIFGFIGLIAISPRSY